VGPQKRNNMDKESLKRLKKLAFPKKSAGYDFPFETRFCPHYEGYIPEDSEYEICGWCGNIKYYH
jgi:hypothetical protein